MSEGLSGNVTTAAMAQGATGLFGSGLDFGISAAASKTAWSRQKRMMQKAIQWRVGDMRKAGINPILAAGSIGGGGGSPPPGAQSNFATGALTAASIRQTAATIKNINANTAETVQKAKILSPEATLKEFLDNILKGGGAALRKFINEAQPSTAQETSTTPTPPAAKETWWEGIKRRRKAKLLKRARGKNIMLRDDWQPGD